MKKKLCRLIALLVFMGPLWTAAVDTCCAIEETGPSHAEILEASGSLIHFESADMACNDQGCTDCALCHVQPMTLTPSQAQHRTLNNQKISTLVSSIYSEITFRVLTPPPTL